MNHRPKLPNPSGFSLIVTILVMSLLSMVIIGLVGLSSISLRSSSKLDAQATARANARLGLITALGELQRYLGPDQRISARAETLAKDPRIGGTVSPNTPQAWWVGASHSDREIPIGSDEEAVVWLVSGLDADSSPKSQLEAPFENAELDPVPLFTSKSLNLEKLTGGEPVVAGRIPLSTGDNGINGAMAYFIDDNGMKAQLATRNLEASNNKESPLGGGVIPGIYDLGVLHEMEKLTGTKFADFQKLGSIRDLPLIGAPRDIAKDKYFSYTCHSYGVLADVRKGGLKRDLNIAFEHDDVFSQVFPKGSRGNFDPRYIVMDAEKLDSESDLNSNGYIHFEIFKDYYNIKKYIDVNGGIASLDPILFNKAGIYSSVYDGGNDTPFGQGQLGPHAIGGSGTPSQHRELPYGNIPVLTSGTDKDTESYKHSPVGPVLSRLQQNAWVETKVSTPKYGPQDIRLRTNVQLWASHYNPYNISLKAVGDYPGAGLRIITYPQVQFEIPGFLERQKGLGEKRESHVPYPVTLHPGRSHVCAFKSSGAKNSENDKGLYDARVRDRTTDTIYTETKLQSLPEGSVTLNIDFYLQVPSIGHGTDNRDGQYELSQVFWAPFAWEKVEALDRDDNLRDYPGRHFEMKIDASELNDNAMVSHSFNLRTSREEESTVRPLVDANVRAMLCNPKWDAALKLPLLAAYSADNRGEAFDPFFPMDRRDNPKGYSYWGADRTPVDGYDRVILFDIPRQDLVSLGQLQHANAGRFSYEPTYITGNSYANPRIPKNRWETTESDSFSSEDSGLADYKIQGSFKLYDASYLVNEELFDSYIFTTIPQVRDNLDGDEPSYNEGYFDNLLSREQSLPNPRFIPYEPAGLEWSMDTLQDKGDDAKGSFFHNAGHLLVDGPFNVNSTSIDAWEAFLSGTYKLPVGQMTPDGVVTSFQPAPDGVRFPRVQAPLDDGAKGDKMDESFWTGFRELTKKEVRELATGIVEQVRLHGPFLTLGEFVNRKLEDSELGDAGPLQAALDKTINKKLDSDFGSPTNHERIPKGSNQAAGFPGYLMQGDILQALSPLMTPRSDSFTIRAYGEAINPNSGKVEARAWCEAVVQRLPDPVRDSTEASPLEELVSPSSRFGREFQIVSFRWLTPEEV